jgi:L-threonylcarbamoyladenylate synthase
VSDTYGDASLPPLLPADDTASINAAVEHIRAGRLVVVPTETVYGVACLPTDESLASVIAAKGRAVEKGITLAIDDVAQVAEVALVSEVAARLADAFWPGPLTLVLPLRPGVALPDLLTGGGGNIGFRIPDHPVPRAIARACGPLPLTSANASGAADSQTAADAAAAMGSSVALVLDGGTARGGVPSTVVAVTTDGEWRVLRQGAIERERLEQVTRSAG